MCQIFVILLHYVIKTLFNLNFKGNEKFELFPQQRNDFQHLKHGIFFTANREDMKKFAFEICTGLLQFYSSKKARFCGKFVLLMNKYG